MEGNLREALAAPFDDSDIEWRLQWADESKGSGIAVPYVTNRAIQSRLDSAAGIAGWKNEYIPWHGDGKKASQLCGISIYFESRGEWISKFDGAEDPDIEPVKGGLSDSMKRAAVQWGVGRYLYSMETVFVDVEKRGRSVVIKESSKAKLNEAHQRAIRKVFKTGQRPAARQTPAAAGSGAPPPDDQKESNTPQMTKNQASGAAQNPKPAASGAPQQPAPAASNAAPQPAAVGRPPGAVPNVNRQPAQGPPPAQLPGAAAGNMYRVVDTAMQPSTRGANTHLRLQGRDGRILTAFMQGGDPALAKGAIIENAVITQKTKDGIVFNTLDSFTASPSGAA